MKLNEYQCGHCNGIFTKGWSDEEAKAEATSTFGKPPEEWKDEQVVICDDCYRTLMGDARSSAAIELAKKII